MIAGRAGREYNLRKNRKGNSKPKAKIFLKMARIFEIQNGLRV